MRIMSYTSYVCVRTSVPRSDQLFQIRRVQAHQGKNRKFPPSGRNHPGGKLFCRHSRYVEWIGITVADWTYRFYWEYSAVRRNTIRGAGWRDRCLVQQSARRENAKWKNLRPGWPDQAGDSGGSSRVFAFNWKKEDQRGPNLSKGSDLEFLPVLDTSQQPRIVFIRYRHFPSIVGATFCDATIYEEVLYTRQTVTSLTGIFNPRFFERRLRDKSPAFFIRATSEERVDSIP